MTDEQNDETQNKPVDPPTDWQSKFEGQQKVNRDLERKLNEARSKADRVDELEKQIAELQGKASEYEAARKEQAVKDDALKAANARILKAEVRAASAGKLRDPADALRYLDLSDISVSDDGEADTETLNSRIDALLKERPYLAADPTPAATGVQTVPPSGARDGDRKQAQLTREDLKRMSSAEINRARLEGRLDKLMGR